MNICIFSRDRSAQLELLLRSMKRFAPWMQPKVLYKYTTLSFGIGYRKLMREYTDIWVKEDMFKFSLLANIDPADPFTMFLCDDDVLINPYTLDLSPLDNPDNACISLRLNPYLKICQPSGMPSRKFEFNEYPDEVIWSCSDGDYAYPMSLDGHIFRTSEILPLLVELNYNNPNELERELASHPIDRPCIKMYDRSTVLNLPLNQVQTSWDNPHGTVSAEYLNEQFLQGKVIDLEPYIGYKNTACHEILPVKFITLGSKSYRNDVS